MAIIKNRLKKLFTQIPNGIITDLSISAPALRMYLYIASKPDGWNVNNKDLMKNLGIGSNNSIAKYWKQLIKSGWVSRNQIRSSGKFGDSFEYILHEYPIVNTEIAKSDNSVIEPSSQKNRNRKSCEIVKSAKHINNDLPINKEVKSNTLSKREKERENFKNFSFKEFKDYLIKNYSDYVLLKYKEDEYISLSSTGYIELNSKIVNSDQSFEIWEYLYKKRDKLDPISKDELQQILDNIKQKRENEKKELENKIEIVNKKSYLNVLTGQNTFVQVIEILDNNKLKVQFNFSFNGLPYFIVNGHIDDFLKYKSYLLDDNGFKWID